jgi:hypothetical protein
MGTLRINARNRNEAYAVIPGLRGVDVFVDGDKPRNRLATPTPSAPPPRGLAPQATGYVPAWDSLCACICVVHAQLWGATDAR